METSLSRREFLGRTLVAISGMAAGGAAHASNGGSSVVPDPKTFQSGDFIWPRKPGDFVPYEASGPTDFEVARQRWNDERALFIAKVRANPNSTPQDRQFATNLEAMDFREFLSFYEADQPRGVPQPFGGGAIVLYVGHVGIVSVDQGGNVSVVEALWGKGVVRTPYDQWLTDRAGSWVWQGRVANESAHNRALIASEGAKYLGKPYDFWNFDLSDSASFYCSKLCWLSIFDALGIAIDNRTDAKRSFWFSPKQLMRCPGIEMVFSPGNYTVSKGQVISDMTNSLPIKLETVRGHRSAWTARGIRDLPA
ncbi:MAG: YiiX/YebB-like N1pC/P60 family cysteine hydrolase [Usitatibacter sp.]